MSCSPTHVRRYLAVACVAGAIGCHRAEPPPSLGALAQQYVKLVLATGVHNSDEVDMFYGPPEWQREAATKRASIMDIQRGTANLVDGLSSLPPAADTGLERRRQNLLIQANALRRYLDVLSGTHLSFDEESRSVYGLAAPLIDDASLGALVDKLDGALPGVGPVAARLERFTDALTVPPDRMPAVVDAALKACRAQTAEHLPLPEKEHVEIAYVHDRPWSAYARYQGAFTTRIEINIDLPRRPDQILDLMCHEGYPGHHVQYSLLEARFVGERGWVEYQIAPFFSPASALAEGAATAAVDVAFSPGEREAFERDRLFPIAGLAASSVAAVENVRAITNRLSVAGAEAARRYLDGRMDRPSAISWLERYGAMPRPTELLAFVGRYRSYVVGYTVATSAVWNYVNAGRNNSDARWSKYEDVIMDPAGAGWLQGRSMK